MNRTRAKFPIRLKLLLLLLCVSGFIIVLFAGLLTYTGQKATQSSAARLLATVRYIRASQVRGFLRNRSFLARALANSSDSARLISAAEPPLWVNSGVSLETSARELGFTRVVVLGLDGSKRYATKNSDIETAMKLRAEIAAGSSPRSRFLDFPSGTGGDRIAWVGTPIWVRGAMAGTLVLGFGQGDLRELLSGAVLSDPMAQGTTGETFLVGPDQRLRTPSKYPEGRDIVTSESVGSIMSTLPVKRVLNQETSIMVAYGTRERVVLSAFTPVRFEGISWGLVTEMELDEAYAPVTEAQQQIVIWTAGAVALVALLAFIISRQFVKPIVRLTDAASSYGRGETVTTIKVRTHDEVEVLADTFLKMVREQKDAEQRALSLRRNIVHDLKSPVTVIKGCAETLHMGAADPALTEELLGSIVEQSNRLLEDLREIISPVGDDWSPKLETFDLSELLHRAVASEKHTERAAHHRFVVLGGDLPVPVTADRRKIRRVIENLLSNAVKYSPGIDKSVILRLDTTEGEATVSFQDEGIGLSEADLQKVMNEAGRVADTQLGIEGSGFGLDSCRHVLEAHGGRLTAKSERGKGSTFSFTIPRVATPNGQDECAQ